MRQAVQTVVRILVCSLALAGMVAPVWAGHDSGGGGPADIVALEMMTANLSPGAAQESHILQVGIQLKLDDPHEAEMVKAWMPKIRHEFLLVICSHTSANLATVEGREALVDEFKEAANSTIGSPGEEDKKGHKAAAKGPVTDVLFSSFLIQ